MMPILFLVVLCLADLGVAYADYYVSPGGSDTNPGTEIQPFATLARARDAVRTVNGAMASDITVYLRGGTYQLPDTLVLDQTDSGTNGHYVVYKAYSGERPSISGGRRSPGGLPWATAPTRLLWASCGSGNSTSTGCGLSVPAPRMRGITINSYPGIRGEGGLR